MVTTDRDDEITTEEEYNKHLDNLEETRMEKYNENKTQKLILNAKNNAKRGYENRICAVDGCNNTFIVKIKNRVVKYCKECGGQNKISSRHAENNKKELRNYMDSFNLKSCKTIISGNTGCGVRINKSFSIKAFTLNKFMSHNPKLKIIRFLNNLIKDIEEDIQTLEESGKQHPNKTQDSDDRKRSEKIRKTYDTDRATTILDDY